MLYDNIINSDNLNVKFQTINKFIYSVRNDEMTFTEIPYAAELFLDVGEDKNWGDIDKELDKREISVRKRTDMKHKLVLKATEVILERIKKIRNKNELLFIGSTNNEKDVSLAVDSLEYISFNLSTEELEQNSNLLTKLTPLFSDQGEGFKLIIELPEGLNWETYETEFITVLGHEPFLYALDDFFSPLAGNQGLIKEFINDKLMWIKLDYKAFKKWKSEPGSNFSRIVETSLINWVNSRRLKVIIEGVEDIECRTFIANRLRELGLNQEIYIQGFDVWPYLEKFHYNPGELAKGEGRLRNLAGFGACIEAEIRQKQVEAYKKILEDEINEDRKQRGD